MEKVNEKKVNMRKAESYRLGGLKTAVSNKTKYGEDYYHRIGALGGQKSGGTDFAKNPELARLCAKLGGMNRRNPEFRTEDQTKDIELVKRQIANMKLGKV